MVTVPYLHFQGGRCAEALAFYADVLGGSDLRMVPYAEMPGAPAEWRSATHVMHGQVTLPGGTLMASDFPPGFEGDPQKAVSIMQTFATAEAARAAFDRLLDGGDVIDDFKETFFSPGFGMVRDRFGTHWILSTEGPDGSAAPQPAAGGAP